MRKVIGLLGIIVFSANSYLNALNDTLSLSEILTGVYYYHPTALQAKQLIKQSHATLKTARGAFDPKLFYQKDHKYYEGDNYFDIHHTSLKIPTWYGIEIQGGYEYANGQNLNPETALPLEGLTYAGVNINLLKGLVIDERRAALKMAQSFIGKTQADAEVILNQLVGTISRQYIEWLISHQLVQLLNNTVLLNNTRQEQLRISVKNGERAAIDTLEGYIINEGFKLQLLEANARLTKAKWMLSTHIWGPDLTWYEITENSVPTAVGLSWLDTLIRNYSPILIGSNLSYLHPNLKSQKAQIQISLINRNLQKFNALPSLQLKYHALNNGWNNWSNNGIFYSNYKLGLDASIPLLFRTEIGRWRNAEAQLKIASIQYDYRNREIQNNLRAQWQNLDNYRQIYSRFSQLVADYEKLVNAEEIRLGAGESTLFQLYTRELRFVDAKMKLTENYQKLLEAIINYGVESGQFHQLLPRN